MVSLFLFFKCSFSGRRSLPSSVVNNCLSPNCSTIFVAFLWGVKNSLHQADSLQVPLVPLFREGDTLLKA